MGVMWVSTGLVYDDGNGSHTQSRSNGGRLAAF